MLGFRSQVKVSWVFLPMMMDTIKKKKRSEAKKEGRKKGKEEGRKIKHSIRKDVEK